MIGKKKQGLTDIENDIAHNRISGIEIIDEQGVPTKYKYIIGIALLAVVVLATVIILVTFVFKKPGPFTSDGKIINGNGDLIHGSPTGIMNQTENPLLRKAIESYKSGYIPNAITEFTDVVESDTNDRDKAIALTYLGLIADRKGDYSSALNYFSRAEGYDRNNPEIYMNMARTYRNLKQYDNAIKNAEKSSELSPQDINPLILMGNINYELTHYDDALRYYQKALRMSPDDPSLLYNTALALFKKGERFQALEYLKKAGEQDRLGEVAYRSYSRLGAEYLESNMFDLAEKYLKQASDMRPQDGAARYNLGVAYLRQNKSREALKEFEEAERLSQDNTGILEQIGESYFSMKEYDRSLRSYEKVLETKGRDVKVLSRIGEIHYSKGDLERAYEAYKKVTRIQPATENARIAYLNMGNILDDSQRYDEAVKAYESALAVRDNDDLTYYNLGIAYKHSDQAALAVNSWKKGAQINPDNIKIRLALADYYNERGYADLAEKEYQDIIYKWPSNQEALFKLGTIYHRQKNYGDAKKAYGKVVETDENTEMARKSMINLAVITSADSPDDRTLDSSIKYIQKALLLKQDDADALLALGIIYSRQERYEKAIEAFYQSIKASRDSRMTAEAYNNIGKSYYQIKQYKKAIQAFAKGVEEDPSNEEIRINRKTATQAYEAEIDRMQ